MFRLPSIKAFSLLLLMALGACSTEPAIRNEDHVRQMVDFGERYFESLKGPPLSDEIKATKNRHVEGQMDEWHTAKYEGSTAIYYRVVSEKRNILASLEITSSEVPLPFGINIGASRSTVWNVLGKPAVSTGDEITYMLDSPYAQSVVFTFSRNTLVKVSWENGID